MQNLMNPSLVGDRLPTDPDLVKEIVKIFLGLGHLDTDGWTKNPTVEEAKDKNPKLQRFLINRYWRLTLGNCSENTTAARFCLMDTNPDLDALEYLKIFKQHVAPLIIKNNL
jgi:hypothetical protein